jgi:hypothetical protein
MYYIHLRLHLTGDVLQNIYYRNAKDTAAKISQKENKKFWEVIA